MNKAALLQYSIIFTAIKKYKNEKIIIELSCTGNCCM